MAEAARTVASALTVPNLEKPFAATPSTALGEPTALLSHRLQAHAGASNSPDATVLSHMSQTQREDLKMLSLASGNSKKAKSLRRDMLHGRRQTNKKIVYADGEAMSMDVTPDSSAILPNTSQVAGDASSPAVPVLNSSISYNGRNLQKPVDLFPNGITKRPPPPPPSTRTDLPANVVVTSVDVEAEDFVPGVTTPDFVAPPQVPHFTQRRPSPELPSKAKSDVPATTKATPDASAYFNAYSGYYGSVSQNGKGKQKKRIGSSKDVNVGIVAADVEKYAAKLDENHWQGWPTLENIETGLFETYKSVTAPGDGEQVAVKVGSVFACGEECQTEISVFLQVLELSPTSFLPALSLYYGVVLSLTSSPHSSAIRLKLHPSCRPYTGLDQHKSHEDLVEGVETEPHYPRYFGEDLQSPLDDAEQPDIKEIKLDDIVDCRRIV